MNIHLEIHPLLKAYISCICHLQTTTFIYGFWVDQKKIIESYNLEIVKTTYTIHNLNEMLNIIPFNTPSMHLCATRT